MNYQKHYNSLIEKAKNRILNGYSEKHHIIPKCLGGSNDKSNLVRLTPEEHYIAHLLLVKMYPENVSLLWASVCMTNGTENMPRKNKLFGWLRKKFSSAMKIQNTGRKASEESKRKMSEARLGKKMKPHSEQTKLKMSQASKGKLKTEAHKKALSLAKIGKVRKPHSEETKQKIRESNRKAALLKDWSYKQSLEYKEKQSEKSKAAWAKRKLNLINNEEK